MNAVQGLKKKITLEEYEKQGKAVTQTELEGLQNYIRAHDDLVWDKTRHLKSQIKQFGPFRFHVLTWKQCLKDPFFWIDMFLPVNSRHFGLWKSILLANLGCYFIMSFAFGLSLLLLPEAIVPISTYESFAPITMYILFTLMYATQKSTWRVEDSSVEELKSFYYLSGPWKASKASDITKHILDTVYNNPAINARKKKLIIVPFVLSIVNTALPALYCYLQDNCRSCFTYEELFEEDIFRQHFAIGTCLFYKFWSYFFCFLFYFIFLCELGISVIEFYRGLQTLKTLESITRHSITKESLKNQKEVERQVQAVSIKEHVVLDNSVTEEFVEDDTNDDDDSDASEELDDDLDSQAESDEALNDDKLAVYFSLNTPENIICWSKVRDFLRSYSMGKLVQFEIPLAILLSVVLLLCTGSLYRWFFKLPIRLFDILAVSNVIVLGIYVLIVIAIGARIDMVTRNTIRLLYLQQWNLEQQVVKFNAFTVSPDQKIQLPFDYSNNTSQTTTPLFSRTRGRAEESHSKSRSLPRVQPPYSPITSPRPDEDLKMYQICQSLLYKLIKVIQEDDPINVLGISLNYGLFVKVLSYISLAIFTGFQKLANM